MEVNKKTIDLIFADFEKLIRNSRDKYGCLDYKVYPKDLEKLKRKWK